MLTIQSILVVSFDPQWKLGAVLSSDVWSGQYADKIVRAGNDVSCPPGNWRITHCNFGDREQFS